jgi:hypothetical protein
MKEAGELSMTSGSLNAIVSFRERKSSPSVDFSANLHNPSVNRIIPRERVKLRLQAQFFDVVFEPFKGTAQFKFSLNGAKTPVKLPDLKDFLTLLHMFHVSGSQGIRMEIVVDGQVLSEGKLSVHEFATDTSEELAIVDQALALARAYNIEWKVSTTVDELIALRRPINVFYGMIENPSEQLTVTFLVKDPIQVTDHAGVILRAHVVLGSYSLYCVFGILGRLEQIGRTEYKLVSREKAFHKRVLKEKSHEVEDSELADLIANVEHEMEAAGVDPIIAFKTWWAGISPSRS